MTIAIFVLLVALSAANGGNDVPKGVATLTGPAGRDVARLNRKTLRDFAIAWTVTPIVAALIAVAVFLLAR